ncbi:unnamed protein product [Meganyctiphanes norvegica]|uniref:Secreted peptide n=1 Tax=Meganyctiphanes norvegica TaxID=48144 RepID=A0AAV2RZR4_MEGNR
MVAATTSRLVLICSCVWLKLLLTSSATPPPWPSRSFLYVLYFLLVNGALFGNLVSCSATISGLNFVRRHCRCVSLCLRLFRFHCNMVLDGLYIMLFIGRDLTDYVH